jgi:hypothetical protein
MTKPEVLSMERAERWRAACAWLEEQPENRVRSKAKMPDEHRELIELSNRAERDAVDVIICIARGWILRRDYRERLAVAAGEPGALEQAEAIKQRAIGLYEAALSLQHTHINLAVLEGRQVAGREEDRQQALELLERARCSSLWGWRTPLDEAREKIRWIESSVGIRLGKKALMFEPSKAARK